MIDEHGREAAKLGDTTDHGGRVVEAAPTLTVEGIPVALDGHLVECPKCGGRYPIIATGRRTHHGIRVGYLGDKTGCGATLIRG
ncbi:MAG: PAAR domain-containing protein [Paraburkholderia sp.]|uniref:PAAR domain-containing protein n=1 Tax=Paraburkholderia sp. TaxID=1926495 RepID=UPI0012051F94|nr:PAAR domain-containing protein [Paraburkholderia sp.]TAL94416.1 MAG: PAAR domain-containing protein [Paraburkholderia sp.]